jgi:SAM-dependent methyltransferase
LASSCNAAKPSMTFMHSHILFPPNGLSVVYLRKARNGKGMLEMQYRQQLRETYNRFAEERDTGALQDWKEIERNRFVGQLHQSGTSSLLEIGAGPGRDSLFFQEQGFRVTAVDLSPEMVRLCREKGLEAEEMDMAALRFPDASFDSVYALNCLLHIPKSELGAVLGEIRRVLAPGGLFYMGVYGGMDSEGVWEQDTYEPKRFFAMYEDTAMQEAVERVFETVYFGTVKVAASDRQPHFQSMILRRAANVW